MELVFIDGHVEKVEGNRIVLPKDSCTPVPCSNERWKSWKRWPWELEGMYVLEKGVVLFEYFDLDMSEHIIKVYKEGKEIYKFEGVTNCDCNLRRPADIDAFQSGHLAGQNGHPETQCLL